jgi:hypothetical protein
MVGLTGSYSGQEVAAQSILQPRSGVTSPNVGTSYLNLRRLDLTSNFPQFPEKLVVVPIAPNAKKAGFQEFALSIDGTFDCPVRP